MQLLDQGRNLVWCTSPPDILLERRFRLLNDAHFVSILGENIVNASPAGTIRPGAVYEHDVFYGRCNRRCSGEAEGEKGGYGRRKVEAKVSVDHMCEGAGRIAL